MTAPISHEFLALQDVLAGRYSIERELGRGGMGIVLLARGHPSLGTPVGGTIHVRMKSDKCIAVADA